jgi:uncharacterized membrane protein YgcG
MGCDIPLRLLRLQHVDFTAGFEAALRSLIARLGAGAPASRDLPVRPVKRKWHRRVFLLYAPSGVVGWVVHLLFYGALVVVTVASVPVAYEEGVTEGLTVALVWALILAILGWFARLLDRAHGTPNPRTFWQRTLLWYWPDGLSARILHLWFYQSILVVVAGVISTAAQWRTDHAPTSMIFGLLAVGALAALVRGVARRIDRASQELALPCSRSLS